MSTSRLSLLVCLCLVGIALMLHWYLAAESRAWAATRTPAELPPIEWPSVGEDEDAQTLDVTDPAIEIPASTAARPAPRPTSSGLPTPSAPEPVRSAVTPSSATTPLGAR